MKKAVLLTAAVLLIGLLFGCENVSNDPSTIPAIYVGTYSGTWVSDGIVEDDLDDSNNGTWTITVDAYGIGVGSITPADTSFTDNLTVAVASNGSFVGFGTVVTSFSGQMGSDGTQVTGTWSIADFTDPKNGTFTGNR